MKHITLIRRDNPDQERSTGLSVKLLSFADSLPEEFDTTITLLKLLLQPDVEILVQDVEDRITHKFAYSNMRKV